MRALVRRTAVRRAIRPAILVLLVVGSLLGLPTSAFARGGGGGHSGGGHSSGGGGGVGGSSGGVAYFGYDPIGILVLILIAAVILGLLFLVVRRHPVVHDDFQPVPVRAGPDPAL